MGPRLLNFKMQFCDVSPLFKSEPSERPDSDLCSFQIDGNDKYLATLAISGIDGQWLTH
jgi:hypothetical protein